MAKIKKIILTVLIILLCMLCISGIYMLTKNKHEDIPTNGMVYIQILEFDTNTIYFNMAA